ncbi:DUF4139 domain-containing protein [Acuticoccus sp. M5D2P5]|uniref:DUF4139 domain-containing protein n=1 Tax=Acuticoccus kalidii TaxID=2910977 RepID=UPI001F3E76C9|nr:DUF4139 domain-containing protein [Acuticoccus kalidii]MCF3932404.1 DUF4139 domain-containing protein [Acuticoccus kalidii]
MPVLRTLGAFAVIIAASVPAIAQDPTDVNADPNIAVTRVTLATGGLAEVEGAMNAPGSVMRLAIERPQVADVLRTLVVTGDTPVVSIDMPAAEPIGARSPAGRLLAGDLSDPLTVLGALVGETVQLKGGPVAAEGRLLGFTPIMIPPTAEGEPRPAVRVSLAASDGTVRYATFPSLDTLSIEGDAVARRMAELMPALGESVDDGRRQLAVKLAHDGLARFSFVVPTTVWRPSYRALIDAEGQVDLQGWATLENTTGLDWNGIDLRLAVGTPVAYQQDVYSPLRTSRPVAPFEVGRTAETDIVAASAADVFAEAQMAAPAPMVAGRMARQKFADEAMDAAPLMTGGEALVGSASTTFIVPEKIDLDAGRTLSVPFLSAAKEASRIAYVDLARGTDAMDALELAFDADATVPGGLIAVYDADGFAGDARFAGADGGEVRILPFAHTADLDVTMTDRASQSLVNASLRAGTLRLTRNQVTRTTLALDAKQPVTLVADQNHASGTDYSIEASDGVGTEIAPLDDRRARLRAELPAGASRIEIVATRPQIEGYRITTLSTPMIEEVLALGGRLDDDTRASLERVIAMTAEIAALDRRIQSAEADIADLREAVKIDRENLEAIDVSTPEGGQVRQRIVERTNTIDTRLQELRTLRRDKLEAEAALGAI